MLRKLFLSAVNFLGMVYYVITGLLNRSWDLATDVPYEDIGRGIILSGQLVFALLVGLFLVTVAGYLFGLTGHPLTGAFLLSYSLLGLILVMVFAKIVIGLLALAIFTVKLAWAITINPAVWAIATGAEGTWNVVSWPIVQPVKFTLDVFRKLAGGLLLVFGREPEEIEKILKAEPEKGTDWPSWQGAWADAKTQVTEAASKAEETAISVLSQLEKILAFVFLTGLIVFLGGMLRQTLPGPTFTEKLVFFTGQWLSRWDVLLAIMGISFFLISTLGLNNHVAMVKGYIGGERAQAVAGRLLSTRSTREKLFLGGLLVMAIFLAGSFALQLSKFLTREQYAVMRISQPVLSASGDSIANIDSGQYVLVNNEVLVLNGQRCRAIRLLNQNTYQPSGSNGYVPVISLRLIKRRELTEWYLAPQKLVAASVRPDTLTTPIVYPFPPTYLTATSIGDGWQVKLDAQYGIGVITNAIVPPGKSVEITASGQSNIAPRGNPAFRLIGPAGYKASWSRNGRISIASWPNRTNGRDPMGAAYARLGNGSFTFIGENSVIRNQTQNPQPVQLAINDDFASDICLSASGWLKDNSNGFTFKIKLIETQS